MLPHVVLTNVTKHSFKIDGLFYSDLLHATSQFMTPRSTLKYLANNYSQLVTTTSLDHRIFCMHVGSSLMRTKNSRYVYGKTIFLCM